MTEEDDTDEHLSQGSLAAVVISMEEQVILGNVSKGLHAPQHKIINNGPGTRESTVTVTQTRSPTPEASTTSTSPSSSSSPSTDSSATITDSSSVFSTTIPPATTSDINLVPTAHSQSNVGTPQNPKISIPIIAGSIISGVLFLLLVIVVLRRCQFRGKFTHRFESLGFRRHRQSFGITALPMFTPHVPKALYSKAQRELPVNRGTDQPTERSGLGQSLAPTVREKLPIPKSTPPPSFWNHTEHDERSQGFLVPPHADGDNRNILKSMERAFQGLRSQFGVMAQRVAQLESELAEQAPPDYTSSPLYLLAHLN
ncbi:hypothetical protein PM082_018643 [Marasmius tenuissimus]|nr:hypothetical protein PM082_018643 [Marasmius tenuissimus]